MGFINFIKSKKILTIILILGFFGIIGSGIGLYISYIKSDFKNGITTISYKDTKLNKKQEPKQAMLSIPSLEEYIFIEESGNVFYKINGDISNELIELITLIQIEEYKQGWNNYYFPLETEKLEDIAKMYSFLIDLRPDFWGYYQKRAEVYKRLYYRHHRCNLVDSIVKKRFIFAYKYKKLYKKDEKNAHKLKIKRNQEFIDLRNFSEMIGQESENNTPVKIDLKPLFNH